MPLLPVRIVKDPVGPLTLSHERAAGKVERRRATKDATAQT